MLRVNGGPAGSGTKIKHEVPESWEHVCSHDDGDVWVFDKVVTLRGYWTRCPDCGWRRP